jgi:restriction endonuclease S subunit
MITVKKKFTFNKSQLNRKFRVENNNLDITALISSTGFTVKRINEVASFHRDERDREATKDKTIKYVQISDIDVSLGRIKSYRKFKGSEAPNNARRIMKHGDVLVSTRRPTRGAVVAVPKDFDEEICTIFFTSLRIQNWDEVDPWYLALFLRTSLGRFQFQSMITETAYPVISDEDVESMVILLPPIDTQRLLAQEYETAVKDFFGKLNDP